MNLVRRVLAFVLASALIGCGGGGGGGATPTFRVTGRVLSVVTAGPLNPAPTVQVGSATATAEITDGSFAVDAPAGATEVLIDTKTAFGVFNFPIPKLAADTDVGDLWVGPERVTVAGTVRNSTNGEAVVGAEVEFGGRKGTTSAAGRFALTSVAYSAASPAGFYGIVGTAQATGFFVAQFSAADLTPVAGVVTVDDILVTPSDDENPPPLPYNLWGKVLPAAEAPGTSVRLLSGGVPVRLTTVGADGRYYFWVGAGTYRIEFTKGSKTAVVPSVTLTSGSDVEQRDVTLG